MSFESIELTDQDFEILGRIAIVKTDLQGKVPCKIRKRLQAEKTRLIREFCKDKPIPNTDGATRHNVLVSYMDQVSPGWNQPILDQ